MLDYKTYESMSQEGNPAIITRLDNLAEQYAMYAYKPDKVTGSLYPIHGNG